MTATSSTTETLDTMLIAIRLDKDVAAALATEAVRFLISPAELVRRIISYHFGAPPNGPDHQPGYFRGWEVAQWPSLAPVAGFSHPPECEKNA